MPYFLNENELNWRGKTGFFWGGMCALCAVWTYFRCPEPKGRTYGKFLDIPSCPPHLTHLLTHTGELDVLFHNRVSARMFHKTAVDQFASQDSGSDTVDLQTQGSNSPHSPPRSFSSSPRSPSLASTMSEQVTLLTANDPPVTLTASRPTLTVNSRVFAELLSLPSSAEQDPLTVAAAETAEEFGPFLKVLEGAEKLEFTQSEWETLARLGDKYDSFVVRHCVGEQAWSLEATSSSPLHAFTLATYLNNDDLLKRSALRVLAYGETDCKHLKVDKEWIDRLESFSNARKAFAFDLIKENHLAAASLINGDCPAYKKGRCAEVVPLALLQVMSKALRVLKIGEPHWNIRQQVDVPAIEIGCQACVQRFGRVLDNLEYGWRGAPSFPV
ncbi:hypothetical protein JCM6882_008688 [Rhodosporidiobolus microsporus]